jgi:adenylate cyclase
VLERVQRRLAAILAADVVGYSRLIGADEAGTLRHIRELRRDLIDPTIKDHAGRIVKTTGDGMLVEFPSAVEAVRSAVLVQQAMARTEGVVSPDRRIAFRVGVHQGDVVVEDDDLFGDGVNIAARLESLSEPGGVCVSGRVFEDIGGKLELPFEDRGEQYVKNIARPIRIYSLTPEAIARLMPLPVADFSRPQGIVSHLRWAIGTPHLLAGSRRWAALALALLLVTGIAGWVVAARIGPAAEAYASRPRGPAIAVLPFNNLSGDPAQDFISEGISEELTTVLSRFGNLRVLARNTVFAYKAKAVDVPELGRRLHTDYVVEGSFRRVSDELSVTAQLIDARSDTHVWAQTYEQLTTPTSLLQVQDDIAERIGAAIADIRTGAVAKAEFERARGKPARDLSSYECVVQGYVASAAQSAAEPVRRARACLELTVRRDPTYAEAWAILTRVLYIQRSWGTGLDDAEKGVDLVPAIMKAGTRAVELAPESEAAHFALFSAYAATCQRQRMRIEVDRVLALNPNDADAMGLLGSLLAYAGDWDYGVRLVEKAIALAGPAAPSWWWWAIAKNHYRKGEYAEALDTFRRSYSEQNWLDHLHLVYTLPHLGRIEDARAEVPGLLKLKPDISVREADRYYKTWCFDADFRERMTRALRLAGLREQ